MACKHPGARCACYIIPHLPPAVGRRRRMVVSYFGIRASPVPLPSCPDPRIKSRGRFIRASTRPGSPRPRPFGHRSRGPTCFTCGCGRPVDARIKSGRDDVGTKCAELTYCRSAAGPRRSGSLLRDRPTLLRAVPGQLVRVTMRKGMPPLVPLAVAKCAPLVVSPAKVTRALGPEPPKSTASVAP